jgi:ferredoxin
MRITVDYDVCGSNGECVHAAPNVFRLEDGDLYFEASPEEAERAAVEDAVFACPVQAIAVSDD